MPPRPRIYDFKRRCFPPPPKNNKNNNSYSSSPASYDLKARQPEKTTEPAGRGTLPRKIMPEES